MKKAIILPAFFILLGIVSYFSISFTDQSVSLLGFVVSSEAERHTLVKESIKSGFCFGLLFCGITMLLFQDWEKSKN